MNHRTAIILAVKATILAEIADCTIDESIRYLAAEYVSEKVEIARICAISGLSSPMVRRLSEVSKSNSVF